jgi:hypothetical protein
MCKPEPDDEYWRMDSWSGRAIEFQRLLRRNLESGHNPTAAAMIQICLHPIMHVWLNCSPAMPHADLVNGSRRENEFQDPLSSSAQSSGNRLAFLMRLMTQAS